MENREFVQVLVHYNNGEGVIEPLTQLAFESFNCGGTQNFDFNEEEVDRLLGKDAFVGGDLPSSIIDKIELKEHQDVHATLFFFFDKQSYKEDAQGFLDHLKDMNLDGVQASSEVKNWADWNEKWREYYKPIIVTDRISVYPSWEKEMRKELKEAIWINPGMGFGTGTHETTFLCLKIFSDLMEQPNYQAPEILDLGCGSGILGISALKFLSSHVNFCDIDKNALDNCVENLSLNFENINLEGTTVCSRERLSVNQKYNLIFANILEPVLQEELPNICEMSTKGTQLIISGILEDQHQGIIDLYEQAGWSLRKVEHKNEWYALLMELK